MQETGAKIFQRILLCIPVFFDENFEDTINRIELTSAVTLAKISLKMRKAIDNHLKSNSISKQFEPTHLVIIDEQKYKETLETVS